MVCNPPVRLAALEPTSKTGESSGIYSLLHQLSTAVRCQSTISLLVMGCWCSKEDPVYRCLLKPFSRSRLDSNDSRPLASGTQQNAAGESFTNPFGQRLPGLGVPEEQRRHPVPPRLQQSSERIVIPPARQDLQRTSSQRTAETRGGRNREGSPNSATPSAQYSEGVPRELDKLRSSVVDFVDRYFSQSNRSLRSKARKTIYRLVLENPERHRNSQSRKCNT